GGPAGVRHDGRPHAPRAREPCPGAVKQSPVVEPAAPAHAGTHLVDREGPRRLPAPSARERLPAVAATKCPARAMRCRVSYRAIRENQCRSLLARPWRARRTSSRTLRASLGIRRSAPTERRPCALSARPVLLLRRPRRT